MRHLGAVFTLLIFAGARAVSAQDDAKQFYAGLGFAYGSVNMASNGYDLPSAYKSNIAYYGELGLRIKPPFSLGFEADYYTKANSGSTMKLWFYNAAFAYYPGHGSDFWIKFLAGYASTSFDVTGGGGGYGSAPSMGGFSLGLGFGYDWRLGADKKFAIVPFLQFLDQVSGSTFSNDPAHRSFRSRLFMIGGAIALLH